MDDTSPTRCNGLQWKTDGPLGSLGFGGERKDADDMARVAAASFPALGFDTETALSGISAAALCQSGLTFAVRYLSIGAPEPSDLSPEEVVAILGSGLALMTVQHVRYVNWMPSAQLGTVDGQNAVANARACDLPSGVTIWCDSEGQSGGAIATMAYVNAWSAIVRAGGYDPGLYVGGGTPLDAQQLYSLDVDRYWKSFSQVSEPPCGWSLIQLFKPMTIAGINLDVDVVQYDYKGRVPNWLSP